MPNKKRVYFNNLADKWDALMPGFAEQRFAEILKPLKIRKNMAVLDIGCGTGVLLPHIIKYNKNSQRIMSFDIAEKMLINLRLKYKTDNCCICGNTDNFPFIKSSFDRVICFCAFPHFDDKIKVLCEIFRIMKNSGIGLIAHFDSSYTLNKMHKSLNSPVSDDFLPPIEEVKRLVRQTGFSLVDFLEKEGLYFVIFKK